MKTHFYSPYTGEIIHTDNPQDWMEATNIDPPVYDSATQGCFWRNGAWEIVTAQPEPVPVPLAVSMRQARLALLGAGILATVNGAIAAMPGIDGDAARIEWEFAQEVRRDSPLVQSLVPALGMTDAQLDALFVHAATL